MRYRIWRKYRLHSLGLGWVMTSTTYVDEREAQRHVRELNQVRKAWEYSYKSEET